MTLSFRLLLGRVHVLALPHKEVKKAPKIPGPWCDIVWWGLPQLSIGAPNT